ncbi:extracellular solute-binding protein [Alkalihalobacillus sp. MEB130]|uniref:ABC transporter substrate-binding protein n=1 Tax=Alkalihalobacillus sp. MEB130 TaxID=2976704 RepID=UPI0028DEE1E6|nr:extracellular solute-binding protein [Alkalihalobacillus sp. MEB130]MDT8862492.1 extracellular solute-binding protein [Alkalihalobacillus sp. MEB130]
MRKIVRTFTGILMGAMMLTACGGDSTGSSSSSDSLSLYSGVNEDAEREAIEELALAFTEETGISVDVNFPGTGYEDQLRVRMASNDLPDLFDTHGWAVNRYGEYVADLSDMDWIEHFDQAMAPILKDEDGKVYAFPINQAKDGIMYNANLLEEYGIDLPTTFDEWVQAMETVKEKSDGEVTPLWIPGSNQYTIAQVLDQLSTPLLVTDESNNFEEDLLDGSFDWSNYTPLAEFLKGLQEKDLLNKDVLTASEAQRIELMAQNKIAFAFASGAFGPAVTELNPEIQVGTIPVPAYWEGDEPSWIGGERNTFAVFKDSEKLEEAKQFIEFLAQPENAKKLAEATSLPAGITNVETENYYTEFYDKWAHIQIQPYFDRVYLPSGMWDVYATTGQELLADTLTPEQVSAEMESEYLRLRNQ